MGHERDAKAMINSSADSVLAGLLRRYDSGSGGRHSHTGVCTLLPSAPATKRKRLFAHDIF